MPIINDLSEIYYRVSHLFREKFPEKLENMNQHAHLPFSTENLIYTLMNLMGISYQDYDTTSDIISSVYHPGKRYFEGKPI